MVFSPVNPWTFPINPNFPFQPPISYITNISRAESAVVTTASAHGYTTGYTVRIVFPFPYVLSFGMYQINEQTGTVTVIDSTSFSIDINTLDYDSFVVGTTLEKPQVIPIGQYTNANLDDFAQVNPVNPRPLASVPLFQSPGLQAAGPCSTSQT